MNIFVLDTNVVKCAQYHCDKHVVKMVLETTQLLNNALIKNDASYNPVYRQTHKNHPASIWASESRANFDWLVNLGLALSDEYTFRYGKVHKCTSLIQEFQKGNSRLYISNINMTPFKLCMPEQYHTNDAVNSYRLYYLGSKADIAKWSKREQPYWWKENL
jgi:hypothetical protein